MRIQEATEATKRKWKAKQRITGIKERIVENYKGKVFLIDSLGIGSRANAGELSLVRRGKPDGKAK